MNMNNKKVLGDRIDYVYRAINDISNAISSLYGIAGQEEWAEDMINTLEEQLKPFVHEAFKHNENLLEFMNIMFICGYKDIWEILSVCWNEILKIFNWSDTIDIEYLIEAWELLTKPTPEGN